MRGSVLRMLDVSGLMLRVRAGNNAPLRLCMIVRAPVTSEGGGFRRSPGYRI